MNLKGCDPKWMPEDTVTWKKAHQANRARSCPECLQPLVLSGLLYETLQLILLPTTNRVTQIFSRLRYIHCCILLQYMGSMTACLIAKTILIQQWAKPHMTDDDTYIHASDIIMYTSCNLEARSFCTSLLFLAVHVLQDKAFPKLVSHRSIPRKPQA
jgi:hypothetical protein